MDAKIVSKNIFYLHNFISSEWKNQLEVVNLSIF